MNRVVSSSRHVWRSTTSLRSAAKSKFALVWSRSGGKTSLMNDFKLVLLKNLRPALRCIFHSSPSALMIPLPADFRDENQVSQRDCTPTLLKKASHTEQVPGAKAEKIAFDEYVVILENMLDIPRIVDHNGWWQGRHRYLVCCEPGLPLAFREPFEELMSSLQEPYAISSEWEGTWRSPVRIS